MQKKRTLGLMVVFFVLVTFALGPTAQSASDKKMVQKMVLGGRLGDPWFVLSQALAYFVNKQSDWLRLQVVATPGVGAGPEIAMKDPQKYIFISSYYAMKVDPTLKRYNFYDKDRIIGFCAGNTWAWVTYDDKIKTAQDFVGKRVFIGRKGGQRLIFERLVLKEQGILDKIKQLHGGYGGGRNALRDGLADIGVMNFDYILPAGFKKGGLIEDMETRKPVYYVDIMPKEIQDKLEMVAIKVYPGALDRRTQKKEFWATQDPIYWCADESLDPKVVREVTRILYANADKFTGWHAQGAALNKETVPTYVMSPGHVHKAAMKYYEEQGVKVRPLSDFLP